MKAAWSLVLVLVVAVILVANIRAEDKKEKTLKGTITCAKCTLKIEGQDKCHTVIQVKEDDKDVVYWFDTASSKKYHKPICTESKKGTVKGTISEKDDKKWVKVSKLEWSKDE